MTELVANTKLEGAIDVVSSKSDAQRAILAAGLSNGLSKIYNIGSSDDVLSMLWNIECIGAEISNISSDCVEVKGTKKFPTEFTFNIGESGLALRLLTCICAAHEGIHEIKGEGTINSRKHSFFEENLNIYGAQITTKDGHLPIKIEGVLNSGNLTVDGSLSSQYISGLLMALPLLEGDSVLTVDNLTSSPYVQMTLDTLVSFGVKIDFDNFKSFRIQRNQKYLATDYNVEGDWSAASGWLVASAIGHNVEISGLNLNSSQADIKILEAFEKANCEVRIDSGKLSIAGTDRKAFEFDARHCPDLFPALVVLAIFSEGQSKIEGVSRLRNKESDRAAVLREEFTKLGADISIVDDLLIINGGKELRSAVVESNADHRIAMMLAIAGTMIEGGLTINNAEAVSKSYPEFWDDFNSLTR